MKNEYNKAEDVKSFTFDFFDKEGRTPLHYACQGNNIKCAEMLIFKYGCNIDVCAQNGLRPRDLIQFPSNKQMFQKFYTFVDKRVQMNQEDQIQRDSLLQENNVRLITKRSIVDDIIAKRNAVDVRGTMMAPVVPNSRQSTPNS